VEGRARQLLQLLRTRGAAVAGKIAADHVDQPMVMEEAVSTARADQQMVVLGPEQGTATFMTRGRGRLGECSRRYRAAW
jgi:hypothetical protein